MSFEDDEYWAAQYAREGVSFAVTYPADARILGQRTAADGARNESEGGSPGRHSVSSGSRHGLPHDLGRLPRLLAPVGVTREYAVAVVREAVIAVVAGDRTRAGEVLGEIAPEPAGPVGLCIAGCVGVAAGLLDSWLGGKDASLSAELDQWYTLPAGRWLGARTAAELIVSAGRDRATQSLPSVMIRQGGHDVLSGSILAVAAVLLRWSQLTGVAVPQLAREHIR